MADQARDGELDALTQLSAQRAEFTEKIEELEDRLGASAKELAVRKRIRNSSVYLVCLCLARLVYLGALWTVHDYTYATLPKVPNIVMVYLSLLQKQITTNVFLGCASARRRRAGAALEAGVAKRPKCCSQTQVAGGARVTEANRNFQGKT